MTANESVTRRALIALLLSVISAVSEPRALQPQTSMLQGVVVDQSGAIMPGVTITLTLQQRTWTTASNEEGRFMLPNLPPGESILSAELAGFVTRSTPVVTRPGANQQVRVVLDVAAVTDTVTVSASADIEPALRWNAWMERAPGARFTPVSHLRPDTSYSLTIDLAGVDYPVPGGRVVSRPISTVLDEALQKLLDDELDLERSQLTVLLIPDPRALRVSPGSESRELIVSLEKLRAWLSNPPDEPPADPFGQLATDTDAPFVFGRLRFEVETVANFRGQANIALSIWDGMRPVDELILTFCVAPEAQAIACSRTRGMAETLGGVDAVRLGTSRAPSYPDIALHYIEFPGRRVIGALRQKEWQSARFLTWDMRIQANDLRSRLGTLARDLSLADNDASHRRIGEALYNLLFPLPEARAARSAFEALLTPLLAQDPFAVTSPPSLFIRHITASVQTGAFIPVAFMFIRPLDTFVGYHLRTETPLPLQTYEPSSSCISRWVLLVPGDEVSDSALSQARSALGSKRTAWVSGGAQVYGEMEPFRDWIGAMDDEDPPTVLGVLSHQSEDRLRFAANDDVYAESMNRPFANSVAILSACETAPPGPAAIVHRLNRNGFVAIIATSSKVSPRIGAGMLRELAAVAEAKERPEPRMLATLFRTAQARLWSEEPPELRSNILKFMLLGNGGVTVCGPAPSGAQ